MAGGPHGGPERRYRTGRADASGGARWAAGPRRAVRRGVPLLAVHLPGLPHQLRARLARLAHVRAPRRGLLPRPVRLLAVADPGPPRVATGRPGPLRPAARVAHPAPLL